MAAGFGDMQSLLKQAQDMQRRMQEMQQALAAQVLEGTAGVVGRVDEDQANPPLQRPSEALQGLQVVPLHKEVAGLVPGHALGPIRLKGNGGRQVGAPTIAAVEELPAAARPHRVMRRIPCAIRPTPYSDFS